jgi:putative ABC transport system permease protein
VRAAWLLFRVLHLEQLRRNWLHVLLPTFTNLIGTSLVFGVLVLNSSLVTSYATFNRLLHGAAQIEITNLAPESVQAVTAKLHTFPGVAGIAPVLEQSATLEGAHGPRQVTVLGADARLARIAPEITKATQFELTSAESGLVVPKQLLNTPDIGSGTSITLESGIRRLSFPVIGILPAELGSQLNGGWFVVMPLKDAEAFFGQGVTTILVATAESNEQQIDRLSAQLQRVVGDAGYARPLRDRIEELKRSTAPTRSFSFFVSLIAVVVSAYLVYSTISLSLIRRRRELATLIALGGSRKQMLVRFVAEAGCFGVLGTLAGTTVGALLGNALVSKQPNFLESAYGFKAVPFFPAWTFAVVAGCGIGAALIGAYASAHAVLQLSPMEALRDNPPSAVRVSQFRMITPVTFGAIMILVGIAGSVLRPSTLATGLALAVLGVVFLAPSGVGAVLTYTARLLVAYRWKPGSGVLQVTAAELMQNRTRNITTATASALALALVIAISTTTNSIAQSVTRFASVFKEFDLFITKSDDPFITVPIAPNAIEQLRSMPNIAAIEQTHTVFVEWHGRRVWLFGETPRAVRQLRFVVTGGSLEQAADAVSDRGVVISTQIARLASLRPGDAVRLRSRCGIVNLRVAAIIETWSWPEGTMIVDNHWFDICFGQHSPNQLKVTLAPGSTPIEVAQSLRSAGVNLTIRTGSELAARIVGQLFVQLQPFVLLKDVALLMVFLVVLNSRVLALAQARRQHAVLRAVGLSSRGLPIALMMETSLLLPIVLTLGVSLGLLMQLAGVELVVAGSGLPVHWALSANAVGLGVAATAAAMLSGAVQPAWRAGSFSIVESLRYE